MNLKLQFITGLLLLATISFSQVVTEGNIAKYYFNEGNAVDEIGSNDGVVYGSTLTDDRFGNTENAFQFNNSFIRIDHDENLDLGSGEFSISAWFKTDNNDSYGVIFNKGQGAAIEPRIFIRTMESPQSTFQWRVGDGEDNATRTYTDPSFFDNEWHHLVLVRNSNSIEFYLDANLVDQATGFQLSFINTDSDRPILIGAQDSIINGNIPFGNFFDGELDDYRIYNRAINDLEVDSLFNEGNPVVMTNVEDINAENSIKISPNPVTNQINLESSIDLFNNQFEIFDSVGRIILEGKLNHLNIDVSSIQSGVYFLRIYNKEEILGVERFIKLNE